jgi:predicted secreted protein
MSTHRSAIGVLAVALLLALMPASAGAAESPAITDAITAGVVRTADGFGTSTVIVPSGGYVTYLVRGPASLAGQTVEIWTRARNTDWAPATTRVFDADGVAHYFARVTAWTGFVARYPQDAATIASTHGRIATVSADGSTRIRVECADFASEQPGAVLVSRAVGATLGGLVRITLCSNASTGFSWAPSVVSSGQLTTAGHSASSGGAIPGAAGTETWSFRVRDHGTGYAVLEYSRPWDGGEKGAWLFVLRVN